MKFVNFSRGGDLATGIVAEQGVIDIGRAIDALGLELPSRYEDIVALGPTGVRQFDNLLSRIPRSAPYVLDEAGLEIAPAALSPQKVVCVGMNYSDHAKETGIAAPEQPILFGKYANAVAATGQEIPVGGLLQVDYEAELALVIGRETKDVSVERALDSVFGYANCNDLSERELQFRSGQWLIGKSLDGFLPIGPYLVTADEIDDPQNLGIRGWMNGELRQDSSTSNMIFSVAEIVSYASRYMTLIPGDVIATGTPAGVILGMEEKVWMQSGDRYEVEIAGLGRLRNRLTAG
jgi:2-keto-4-pentenoate hydratase/2-oxohepta-3-ene-1,7-dioic acid hydratase in catechol pathway